MSYMLEALSGSVQASALDLSQNGIATLEFQDQHRRLHHVSTLLVGRLGDLWEWIVLNHQQFRRARKLGCMMTREWLADMDATQMSRISVIDVVCSEARHA